MMKRKAFLTIMVTVAMAASVCAGCGNTAEGTSYETSVTPGQAAAEAGVIAEAAKMEVGKALADAGKVDTVAEEAPEAVEPEEKPAAEEKKAEAKTDTKAADTKAETKAEAKTDTKAADTKAEAKAADTAVSQPQESQEKTGGYTQFIGVHAIAGDKPAKTTTSQQAAGTKSETATNTQPEAAAHQHVWKEHKATKREWIPDVVEVDDYLTQTETVYTGVCNCGATFSDRDERIAHSSAHSNNGEDGSFVESYDEVEVGKVKVGSHTEDHGHFEKVEYVDYVYCDCGAQEAR